MKSQFSPLLYQVRSLIARELAVDLDKVTLNANLRGDRLQADSLDLVSLVLALAQTFKIEMRDDEIQEIDTVGDIVTYMEKYLPVC
jgi:acyl carrier protein